MKTKARENWSYILISLFLIVTAVYILIKQDNIYLQIHDYLDSNIAWIKMLKDNGIFWSKDATVPFLGGIDRNYLYSELKAYMWLFMVFPVFPAIIIGWYVKILMAITGFIFLCRSIDHSYYARYKDLIIWCGFLYGIAPTYPPVTFAFASLPFLLGILMRYYKKPQWKYLFLLLVYPILSDVSLFGIFICGYLVVFFFIDCLVNKKLRVRMLLATAALTIGYILVEWRLFDALMLSGEESLRSVSAMGYEDIQTAWKEMMTALLRGYYHCGSLHTYVVFPVCVIYLGIQNYQYIKKKRYRSMLSDPANWLITWIIFNCIIYGIADLESFLTLVQAVIPFLIGFGFDRTVWLNPFLWYFLFFIILTRIKKEKMVQILALLAGLAVVFGPETYNHVFFNALKISCDVIGEERVEKLVGRELELLTYKDFYSVELFEEIKEDINYKGEWAVAFGMHPSILEYNGIATLDGYLSYYPESYKVRFRKLIEPQLEIDAQNRSYYDSWGGRAYIYSSEITYNQKMVMEKEEANMNIDPTVFDEMSGEYVFSRVRIKNAEELGLYLVNDYENTDSPYIIYLYKNNSL